MINKLMMGVALSAFALSGAMAQSTPPGTGGSSDKPAMNAPAPTGSSAPASTPSTDKASSNQSSSTSTTPSPATTSASSSTGMTTSGAKFVATQNSDQWLASSFKGTDVIGSDDKKIGDVSDILFDKTGKIEAFVVSVGGFLGMGSKDVAIAPTAFEVVKGSNGTSDKLKLTMSKDELKQAQNFEPYKAPQSTTGSGSSTRPGGLGSPSGMSSPRPGTSPQK